MPDLEIPSGVVKTISSKASRGRWTDSNHIRSVNAKPQKWGGWRKRIDDALVDGLIRGLRAWTTKRGSVRAEGGTYTKIYSIADALDDITPLRDSGTLGNDPFTTADGDETVTVAHTTHGMDDGAYATFSGSAAVNGITPDGEYQITYVDANSYTIEHSSAASGTGSGGGASVAYAYQINPGLQDSSYGYGYGSGPYGAEAYGTLRTTASLKREMRHWSIARYGSQRLVSPSGGTVYIWDEPSDDDRATAVSNAPSAARYMFVAPERNIVMLGTSDPMKMEWSDRDSSTQWTAATDNTAGSRTMQAGNVLVAGAIFKTISVIWSDTSLYAMVFRPGSDFIFDIDVAGSECGLMSPAGFAVTPNAVLWWGQGDFHIYAGGLVEPVPRSREIREFIFGRPNDMSGNLDRAYAYKSWACWNPLHRSVIFGYVSVDSTDGEPDRYIEVMLDDDFAWWVGTLTRTAMAHCDTPYLSIFAAGTDSYIYDHETGVDADSSALPWSIESGIVSLGGDNNRELDIIGFEPDFEVHIKPITLTVYTKERPASTGYLEEQEFSIDEGQELVDMRVGGRYAKFKLSQSILGGDFRMGLPGVEINPAGRRR